MNGTSIVEYSIVKVSGTNFKFKYLNISQPSIFIGLGGKPEKLKTYRRVVCAMYMALCHHRAVGREATKTASIT